MVKKDSINYLRYSITYLAGFLVPILIIFLFSILHVNLPFQLEGSDWLYLPFGLGVFFVSGSLNSYLIRMSTHRSLPNFLILFSQYSLFLLYLWVVSTEFDSDVGMPDLRETMPIFGAYSASCVLGAYLGAGNPIQKLIQKYSKKQEVAGNSATKQHP